MKVLMVGVGPQRLGGMWTVSEVYLNNKVYNEQNKLIYVATSTCGSIIKRIICMLIGYVKVLFHLCFSNVDLVHIHMAEKGSAFRKGYIAKWARNMKKKVVIHLHAGPFMNWYSTLDNSTKKKIVEIFNTADKVLVLGEYWKKELTQIIPEEKLCVLYNGVSCPSMNYYKVGNRNIVFMGVLRKEKGIYDLLEAIHNIDGKLDDDIKVQLCGNDLEGDIQQVIDRYILSDRIKMLGWINSSQREDILKNAMIVVLPSYFEGLSMSVIEGMMYGVPIVTTNISTMPELLGKDAWLHKPGDAYALGERLLFLSNSEAERKKISEQVYLRATNIFSETNFIKTTLEIYASIYNKE